MKLTPSSTQSKYTHHRTLQKRSDSRQAGPRLRTLEVRGREGRMGDLPVERLAAGALVRRLRRAEPLGATSVSSRRRTCTDQVTDSEASEARARTGPVETAECGRYSRRRSAVGMRVR
jgi:hypothetical protein